LETTWLELKILLLLISSILSLGGCNDKTENLSTSKFPTIPTQPNPQPYPVPSISVTLPRPSTAENQTICPENKTTAGLDVSGYNPDTNWTSVKSTGLRYAFVKATEGGDLPNPYFASDWAAVKNVGMIRGAYHFFRPRTNALTQANYYLTTVGKLDPEDLPPMFDWETLDGISVQSGIHSALVWLDRVEVMTGKIPIIYIGPEFWNSLGNPEQFYRYPLFIANFEVTCPEIPPPWNGWTFWQAGISSVKGVQSGLVDQDLFNGTDSQLIQFSSTGSF
jgi:GH25 family lysozyme M1 (1,4-beta-N-acetylmuramidase)